MNKHIKQALDRYLKPIIEEMVDVAVSRAIDMKERDIEEMAESAVDSAIDTARIDRAVEDAVTDAVNDLNLERELEKTLDEMDIGETATEAIASVLAEHDFTPLLKKCIASVEFVTSTGEVLTLRVKREDEEILAADDRLAREKDRS